MPDNKLTGEKNSQRISSTSKHIVGAPAPKAIAQMQAPVLRKLSMQDANMLDRIRYEASQRGGSVTGMDANSFLKLQQNLQRLAEARASRQAAENSRERAHNNVKASHSRIIAARSHVVKAHAALKTVTNSRIESPSERRAKLLADYQQAYKIKKSEGGTAKELAKLRSDVLKADRTYRKEEYPKALRERIKAITKATEGLTKATTELSKATENAHEVINKAKGEFTKAGIEYNKAVETGNQITDNISILLKNAKANSAAEHSKPAPMLFNNLHSSPSPKQGGNTLKDASPVQPDKSEGNSPPRKPEGRPPSRPR